jgi:hypothetical protein
MSSFLLLFVWNLNGADCLLASPEILRTKSRAKVSAESGTRREPWRPVHAVNGQKPPTTAE